MVPQTLDNKCNWAGLRFDKKYNRWLNDATFFDYYTRLKELAINMFEWVNLPDTCDPRFLELILFEFGYVLFFRHRINGAFLNLQCAINGPLNMYRIPIRRRAYSVTGFNQECDDTDSVIIFNNFLRQPTSLTIELFAQRLTRLERAIDVNINAQKTPVLITGTQSQRKTLEELYNQYQGNSPVIFGYKNAIGDTPLKVLKTNAPVSYPQLMEAKARLWNEALTFLGVNNANTDKRERLIVDEVNSNNQLLNAQRLVMLNARKQACEMINQLFAGELPNGPIDVRFREEGGGLNEQLYNGSQNDVRSVPEQAESRTVSGD